MHIMFSRMHHFLMFLNRFIERCNLHICTAIVCRELEVCMVQTSGEVAIDISGSFVGPRPLPTLSCRIVSVSCRRDAQLTV